jgi:endonuclease III
MEEGRFIWGSLLVIPCKEIYRKNAILWPEIYDKDMIVGKVLREILPKRFWKSLNGLLVLFRQNLCKPVSPFCTSLLA